MAYVQRLGDNDRNRGGGRRSPIAIAGWPRAGITVPLHLAVGVERRLRAHQHGVKEAIAFEAAVDQLLQSDAEREHGDQRCDAHGDTHRGERIAQDSLAQVLGGKFG